MQAYLCLLMANSYCAYVLGEGQHTVHKPYHDKAYGFPIRDDDMLFGRLLLEINQAGLSWTTILNKQENFLKAYHNFSIDRVAKYGAKDYARLMGDAGIIRNRLKIEAAIANAKTIRMLQKESGSFKNWLDMHHPADLDTWTKLFRKTFRFTGGEIVREFLVSTGYLPGAHDASCPVYAKVLRTSPPWSKVK